MKMGICIVGAGPAGLMAAIHAAAEQAPTLVVEANTQAGRKLLLTGGGRCNFTHADSPEELARAFGQAGRFLRHSLYDFPPERVREFFRAHGLASTVEPDGCVFPASQRAADVRDILVAQCERLGVQILYGSRVMSVAAGASGFTVRTEAEQRAAAAVILATGGVSWPQTGSTGDGYRFAAQLGHTIVPPKPALIPLLTQESWPGELAGVSLPHVKIRAVVEGHRFTASGNMLFTQDGMGGPAVLDLSRLLADALFESHTSIAVCIDVLPALEEARLDRQLQRSFQDHPRKTIATILSELVPRQFARTLCQLAGCEDDAQAGQLSAAKRKRLVGVMKRLTLHVIGTESIAKATVTRGGVRTSEIDPRTLESKIRPGLFFAGEVIDLDGPCGGYNLQMCWSTGAAAGRAAAHSFSQVEPPT